MRIIKIKTLKNFWDEYKDSEIPLRTWYSSVKSEVWKFPNDIKDKYRNASFLANNRVVFNINGNKYRLVVKVNYDFQIVYIRFIGTHRDYDKINASEV